MIVCKECDLVVVVNEDADGVSDKIEAHRLWHHPTEQEIEDCFYALFDTLAAMPILKADENWKGLDQRAKKLVELSQRYHNYMEKRKDWL